MEPQQPSPGDDPRLAPIIAYLEQHQERINIEALRKELREAGHPPELVDEAVRRVAGPEASLPRAWPQGLLIVLANLFVAPFAFNLITSLVIAIFPAVTTNVLWSVLPFVAMVVLPVVELLVGGRLRGGPRDFLGRVLIWGASATLAVMGVLLILFGICVAVFMAGYN